MVFNIQIYIEEFSISYNFTDQIRIMKVFVLFKRLIRSLNPIFYRLPNWFYFIDSWA